MKKNIPLVVLETLEKYVRLRGEQFDLLHPEDFLLKVVDRDSNSNFYFNVEGFETKSGLKKKKKKKKRCLECDTPVKTKSEITRSGGTAIGEATNRQSSRNQRPRGAFVWYRDGPV